MWQDFTDKVLFVMSRGQFYIILSSAIIRHISGKYTNDAYNSPLAAAIEREIARLMPKPRKTPPSMSEAKKYKIPVNPISVGNNPTTRRATQLLTIWCLVLFPSG